MPNNKGFTLISKLVNMKMRGFTLIELLVVITILAILAAIGLVIFSGSQKSARDAKRRSDLKAIATALEIFKQKNGTYPLTGGSCWRHSYDPVSLWIPGLDSNYMPQIPHDPKENGYPPYNADPVGYAYAYYTCDGFGGINGGWYVLIAHLEAPNSADNATQCRGVNGQLLKWAENFHLCNQL